MDLPALATEAAALLAGYALAIGRDVADKTKSAVADRLFGLVKDKFAGNPDGERALDDLLREPANGQHQESVAAALAGALEEDASFDQALRQTITEINQEYGDVTQTATATAPVGGNQIISNIGPGVTVSDSILNNQGDIDQSVHTTHNRGGRAGWLVGVAIGLIIAGTATVLVIGGQDEGVRGAPQPLPTAGRASGSAEPAVDPPLAFDEDGSFLGEPLNGTYALHHDVAYFLEDEGELSLVAAELATGERRWSLSVQVDDTVDEHLVEAVDVNGLPLVFLVAPVTTAGTGTSVDRETIRITAVSAADGRTAWTYDYAQGENSAGDDAFPVFSESHLVIATEGRGVDLDPATGKVMAEWDAPHFVPELISGDVVVGVQGERPGTFGDDTRVLAGRSVSGGTPLWSIAHPHDSAVALGPDLIAVVGTVPDKDPVTATQLVDVRTGTVVARYDIGYFAWFDGESTIVFKNNDHYNFDEHAFALDVTSRELLWELPDEAAGRIAPDIVEARKGAVYGSTDKGPLILDARTGEDTVTDLPFLPDEVTAGYVVAFQGTRLFAYPATA